MDLKPNSDFNPPRSKNGDNYLKNKQERINKTVRWHFSCLLAAIFRFSYTISAIIGKAGDD
jgi:hypothetical protein